MSYQIVHTVLSALGVLINAFLLILAITRSPRIMRPCAAIITVKTGTDIMASLLNYFVMSRIATDGSTILIIPTGPCTSFGSAACYAGHMFMICLLECNLIWLISSYIFRYYILYVRNTSVRSIFLIAFCLTVSSFFHITAWISFFDPKKDTIPSELVGLELSFKIVLSGSIVYWSTIVVFTQLFITAFLVVIAYIWIRDVLYNYSQRMGAITNMRTLNMRRLNKVLLKIVTFQVFLLTFIFLGVIIFAAQYTCIIQHEYFDYMISAVFMCFPIFSPFSYLLFVPHYRNIFKLRRKRTDAAEVYEMRATLRRCIATCTMANDIILHIK